MLVAVILRPRLLCLDHLAADALTPKIRRDRAQPVIKHPWLKFKAHPEPHRPPIELGEEGQDVVPPDEPSLEKVHLASRAEAGVVHLDRLGQESVISD